MKMYLIAGAILIGAGIMALAYGGFTYTKQSDTARLGPIEFTVSEKETVNVPVWAGAGAILLGAGLLTVPLFKR